MCCFSFVYSLTHSAFLYKNMSQEMGQSEIFALENKNMILSPGLECISGFCELDEH